MARVPFTYNAYEVWHSSNSGSYAGRTVVGIWWHKPSEEELLAKLPVNFNLKRVRIDELSVIKREGQWYRLFRRPLFILGQEPKASTEPLAVQNHHIWPVPNEDGSLQGMFYVSRKEVSTIQRLIQEGCTLKACTVNDVLTEEYLLTCRESMYRRICERFGLTPA